MALEVRLVLVGLGVGVGVGFDLGFDFDLFYGKQLHLLQLD